MIVILLKNPMNASTRLSMNGNFRMISTAAPFVLRLSKDERKVFQQNLILMSDPQNKSQPNLQDPIKNPARFPWHEVKKVDHYYLSVDALTQPMRVKEPPSSYGEG